MNSASITQMVLWFVIIIAFMYFVTIRPQKKKDQQMKELMASLEVGDSVLTTSGFYGVVVDMVDDTTVIVEFGNDKHCRIPMEKSAITAVEKANEEKEEA
ncbi:preprotein translocase subunit YajC [Anaerostipes sp. MSJ-23]|uniref:preprotein translocase subunit YajC n=1 Tax=unclassified Anaerostipes TaxID=2635253 RepID=UPI001C10863A|nr:preprotein translocase subunit YajC [Anaerostipes sp. MSJ-23]MBU5459092.1 preprotein translocase subunit YajC [Anaerostipes sp. MSJ-23]